MGYRHAASHLGIVLSTILLTEVFPLAGAVGLILVFQIVMTARDLNRELIEEAKRDRPIIVHPENRPRKISPFPVAIIGIVLVAFVVLGEGFILERAFPAYTMSLARPAVPTPPEYAFRIPAPPSPLKPPVPSGFLQWDHIELLDDPTQLAAGKRLGLNVYLSNPGPGVVRNPQRRIRVVIDSSKPEALPNLRMQFDEEVKKAQEEYRIRPTPHDDIGVSHAMWDTLGEQSLTDDHAKGLIDGTLSVYIFWWAKWDDPLSTHPYARGCQYIQKPEAGTDAFTAKRLELIS